MKVEDKEVFEFRARLHGAIAELKSHGECRLLMELVLAGYERAPFELSEDDDEFLVRTEQRELTSGADQRLCQIVRRAQRTLRPRSRSREHVTMAEANAVYAAAVSDHESSTAANENTRVALEHFLDARSLAPEASAQQLKHAVWSVFDRWWHKAGASRVDLQNALEAAIEQRASAQPNTYSEVPDDPSDPETCVTATLECCVRVLGASPGEFRGKVFDITFDLANGETRMKDDSAAVELLPKCEIDADGNPIEPPQPLTKLQRVRIFRARELCVGNSHGEDAMRDLLAILDERFPDDEPERTIQEAPDTSDGATFKRRLIERGDCSARLKQAESILRDLASYVGNGGYNAPDPIDLEQFAAKIRDGIDHLVPSGQIMTKPLSDEEEWQVSRVDIDTDVEGKRWVIGDLRNIIRRRFSKRDPTPKPLHRIAFEASLQVAGSYAADSDDYWKHVTQAVLVAADKPGAR